MRANKWASLRLFTILILLAALALPAAATKIKKRAGGLDDLVFQRPELRLTVQIAPLEESRTLAAPSLSGDFDALLTRERVVWDLGFDRMTGFPNYMGGEGIPWIPGTGARNEIKLEDLGLKLAEGESVPVAVVAKKAIDFVRAYPRLFGAPADELTLNLDGSGPMLDYLYYVQFNWVYGGVPVEGGRVLFTLNHGNLVDVGQVNLSPAIRSLDTAPAFDAETALQILYGFVGEAGPAEGDSVQPARLVIVPVAQGDALQGLPSRVGEGLGFRLVWIVGFSRPGVTGTWEARVDAHTGELLSFTDTNRYGHIQGGVYKTDQPSTEVSVPLPYANYTGTTAFADAAGNFTGTVGTSTLTGPGATAVPNVLGGVTIVDNCGPISKANDAAGLIDFGTSTGLDCTTPGVGGAGNTHASRTQYWNVTAIKMKAWTYLYGNNWLEGRVTDNVNTADTCNAYWNGTLNFFRSGGGCWNTGELPGVSLHEWGHGLDSNDGIAAADNGSGEVYGDITALLQTHSSCMGNGFSSRPCGYGSDCTQCTGVRDLDYEKYVSPAPLTGTMLASWCPASTTYQGPCGYEGHCESLIASEAVYDLAARDLIAWGLDQASAWQLVDRLWYASRPSAAAVYTCSSLVTSGCATGSLWRIFRTADDDDGNTTNGTPHSTALYAAFNRHLIACTSDAGYNTDSTTCAALPYSGMTAQFTAGQVVLNWNASTGASTYSVYRNETSCEAGYTKIASVTAPTTTYTDTLVAAGVTYFYRVQPVGSTSTCIGPMSDCATATTCAAPAAPATLTATPDASFGVDLAWGSVAGALQYNIYRMLPGAGGFSFLATVSSSLTAYTDTDLVAGETYTYAVRAFLGCESLNSPQASAAAAGACNLPPTFGGVTSVSNPGNATCQMSLAWSAATSNCAGTVTYNIYRSTTASFTPGPGYQIASGVTGTTYTDSGVTYKTKFYYIVRAVDSISGLEDSNTKVLYAFSTGAITIIYSNDFEANGTGWTATTQLTPDADGPVTGLWERADPQATTNNYGSLGQPEDDHTAAGTLCFVTGPLLGTGAGNYDIDYGEVRLTSPPFSGATFSSVELNFWKWWLNDHSETVSGCAYPDGFSIEASSDGGSTWTVLENLPEDTVSTQLNSGTNAWLNSSFLLEDYGMSLTSNMSFRLRAIDGQNTPNGVGVCAGDLNESALDDVVIRGTVNCTSCAPPATPTGLAAVAGVNQVSLSWSAASGAAGYTLLRGTGACPGAGFVRVASGITGTTYTDLNLSSGTTYAYKVVAYTASRCESPESACASAAPTGTCTLPPAFAGVASVSDSQSATCGITVGWSAGTAACSGGSVVYNVYREQDEAPVPGASTLVAKGVTGTTYSDTAGLVYGGVYYYTVRAEDTTAPGEGPNGGTEDANTVAMAGGPSGGILTGASIFYDDFETNPTGLRGWAAGYFVLNSNDWKGVQVCTAASGTHIFRWGGTGCTGTQQTTLYQDSVASLCYPAPDIYGLEIPFGATNVRLTFKERHEFAAGDGGLLYIQKEGQGLFYRVPKDPAIFLTGTYTSLTGTTNVLSTPSAYDCWGGITSTFSTVTVDLDAACQQLFGSSCAGGLVALSFTGSSTPSGRDNGWFLDDVSVTADYGATSCTTGGCAMVVELTPAISSVAVDEDILFTASHTAGTGPYSYQWTEDGGDITGATASTLAVNKATAQSHTYNCKVTDLGGTCSNITASVAATGTWTSGGTASPPAAPNGDDVPGAPLTLAKNGTDLDVGWDPGCTNDTDYRLVWGDITSLSLSSDVTNGTVTSASCSLGTDGTATVLEADAPSPASGQCFFCVLDAVSGTSFGRHGNNSAGNERLLSGDTTFCGATTKDTTATTCN